MNKTTKDGINNIRYALPFISPRIEPIKLVEMFFLELPIILILSAYLAYF